MRKILTAALFCALLFALGGCTPNLDTDSLEAENKTLSDQVKALEDENAALKSELGQLKNGNPSPEGEETMKNPQVTIEMADGGKILVELYPEIAPNTVNNFIYIIRNGWLDGSVFHRVSPVFMIQGGAPANGVDIGYSIKGEFSRNVPNALSHKKGVISMARTPDKDSASSQFFIMTADNAGLDGDYASFGMVIEGMDVVERISSAEWAFQLDEITGQPAVDQTMVRVTVDTFGVEYPDPEMIK